MWASWHQQHGRLAYISKSDSQWVFYVYIVHVVYVWCRLGGLDPRFYKDVRDATAMYRIPWPRDPTALSGAIGGNISAYNIPGRSDPTSNIMQ